MIYSVGIREGSVEEWDHVWTKSQESNVPAEREMMLEALAQTQKPWLLWRYLVVSRTFNSYINRSYTFSKISNWSLYIFTLVLKVRFGYANVHASINQPRLCRDSVGLSLKNDSYSCTDDARVKVPSFQKVSVFLQYETFHRDTVHLYFLFV